MLQLKKKSEYRQSGTAAPVFVYWVIGTAAEIAEYKAIQEQFKTTNGGTRYITDDAPLYNGKPNPHLGAPVFQSFNGPLAEGTELIITDNGQGQNGIVANQIEDAPENTSLEREYVRKRNLAEAAEATALAQMKMEEIKEARRIALNRRNPFKVPTTPVADSTGTPGVGAPNLNVSQTAGTKTT